jgi:hypothetical protein
MNEQAAIERIKDLVNADNNPKLIIMLIKEVIQLWEEGDK